MLRRPAHPAIDRRCIATILRLVSERPAIPSDLQDAILAWYATHGRALAFRRTTDPYAILVSEAMAQQTQAVRAAERWERFMTRFPTVEALADASLADVLREWQGLGYDRRGRDLWRAARAIVADHGGRVPHDLATLETLPGVGPYTARAVAALAFDMPVGAVDTNVRRVLGRIVTGEPVATMTTREMQSLADDAVPPGRSGAWTHALMDIGATICRAASADCEICPAQAWCRFAAAGAVVTRPVGVARERAAPFVTTNRWLRGRILDRLRGAPERAWTTFDEPLGTHDSAAVDLALDALAADGMVELDATHTTGGPRRARLRMT
jgi:A/G-specific adenine glycosylase